MENKNPKINLVPGVASKVVNGKQIRVTEIDDTACNCRFDTCDCALIMTDLDGDGNKYVLYFLNGNLSFSTLSDYEEYKISRDIDDLNTNVFAEV